MRGNALLFAVDAAHPVQFLGGTDAELQRVCPRELQVRVCLVGCRVKLVVKPLQHVWRRLSKERQPRAFRVTAAAVGTATRCARP